MPVFGTSAARFDDDGVTALYHHLAGALAEHGLPPSRGPPAGLDQGVPGLVPVVPSNRVRYLADVADVYVATTPPRSSRRTPPAGASTCRQQRDCDRSRWTRPRPSRWW